jgi:hypothetical protein
MPVENSKQHCSSLHFNDYVFGCHIGRRYSGLDSRGLPSIAYTFNFCTHAVLVLVLVLVLVSFQTFELNRTFQGFIGYIFCCDFVLHSVDKM